MLSILALTIGGAATLVTLLSPTRAKAWWVRIWDFPRLQIAVLVIGALVLWMLGVLSYEPQAVSEQEAPHADTADQREADETIAQSSPGTTAG